MILINFRHNFFFHFIDIINHKFSIFFFTAAASDAETFQSGATDTVPLSPVPSLCQDPISPDTDMIDVLMEECSGLPMLDEEEEPEFSDMEDDDLLSFGEAYDSDAMENDQELLFDPYDRQEEDEEPELLFMEDDYLSSEEETEESDAINDQAPQPSFSHNDRKDMDEEFRRSPLFDWLYGRLTPIQEEDQFELDELEAEQWVFDHPDRDPWAPIELPSSIRCSPVPSPNVHQGVLMEDGNNLDALSDESSQKVSRRFFNSSRKILARIGKRIISCCCIPCGKD
jgi:hypothetical protein